jgi:hypothetical protein
MAGILPRLFPSYYGLNGYESWIVSQVEARLEPTTAERLRKQIDVVNRVQRLTEGKEVNLYQIREGKPSFNDDLRFSDKRMEARLATVTVKNPNNKEKLKADVWTVTGRVFSINFNKPPKPFFAAIGLSNIPSDAVEVKILYDPMHPALAQHAEAIALDKLTGWVSEWCACGLISNVRTPLTPAAREAALDQIDVVLPSDYLQLVEQTDGAQAGSWVIHGPTDIRSIIMPDSTYYILAEAVASGKEGARTLAVRAESDDGMLYLFDLETEERTLAGTLLRNAIRDDARA